MTLCARCKCEILFPKKKYCSKQCSGREWSKKHYDTYQRSIRVNHKVETFKIQIPARVLAEREYRYSLARSIGTELMGEPLPGYSALDRKQGAPHGQ